MAATRTGFVTSPPLCAIYTFTLCVRFGISNLYGVFALFRVAPPHICTVSNNCTVRETVKFITQQMSVHSKNATIEELRVFAHASHSSVSCPTLTHILKSSATERHVERPATERHLRDLPELDVDHNRNSDERFVGKDMSAAHQRIASDRHIK